MANLLANQNPIKVVIYDPINNLCKHIFVYLGNVPKNVFRAAEHCANVLRKGGTARDFGATHEKLLEQYYGKRWKSRLALNLSDLQKDYLPQVQAPLVTEDILNQIFGAHEDTAEDDLINKMLYQSDEDNNIEEETRVQKYSDIKPGVTFVDMPRIYPEDKLSEFRVKVTLDTEIPLYRQHMFYIVNGQVETPYKLISEKIFNIDITSIYREHPTSIFDIPINKHVYDSRENVNIEERDSFTLIGDVMARVDNGIIYICDLNQFILPRITQITGIMKDIYRFDLLYYGFIILFWPQLTVECFRDYIKSEQEFRDMYIDLAPYRGDVMNYVVNESNIIDNMYKKLPEVNKWAESGNIATAITHVTAQVINYYTLVNIRNLFDMISVSQCIPEVHSYEEVGGKQYLLRKYHSHNESSIAFPPATGMKSEIIIAVSLRYSDQKLFHKRVTTTTIENEQSHYLFLNILSDGRYNVRSLWDEEEELNFDDIIKIMKKFINPIIERINGFGKAVFRDTGRLRLISRETITYQNLNICIYWKRVISENSFRGVKAMIDKWIEARIINVKNITQTDKYEYIFKKGMYDFDISSIEKFLLSSAGVVLNNYYTHLSNNAIKQKWDQLYDGRILRISHRTSDVKFDIIDIREHEFSFLQKYINYFIYTAAHNEELGTIVKQLRGLKQASTTYKSSDKINKMRKLREQDPELYNLKKYKSKKNYSKSCQKPRQPLIYTDDEIHAMSAERRKELTKYWNFTTNKPAYYSCPNKKFPHLSFIVGFHPKNYCLPCCNVKDVVQKNTRRININNQCLEKHIYVPSANEGDDDDDEGGGGATGKDSLHIMSYGKEIDDGRISKLPGNFHLLFGGTTNGNDALKYYIVGVSQNLPGISNIGIIFSIARVLGIAHGKFMAELYKRLLKERHTNLFYTLVGGAIANHFVTFDNFTKTIDELLIRGEIIAEFGQGFTQWNELIIELVYYLFDTIIIVFTDAAYSSTVIKGGITSESIELFLLPIFRIIFERQVINHNIKFAVVINIGNRCYPILGLNYDEFIRDGRVEKYMFEEADPIVKHTQKMIGTINTGDDINKLIDYSFISDFARAAKYTINNIYINLHNFCYAITLEKNKNIFYVPINYSGIFDIDKKDGALSYDAYVPPEQLLDVSIVMNFAREVNKFITDKYRYLDKNLFKYALLQPTRAMYNESAPVGLMFNDKLLIPCALNDGALKELNIAPMKINYDPFDVNAVILKNTKPALDNRKRLLSEALYNNNLYQLLVLEFIYYISAYRNVDMRAKLEKLFSSIDYSTQEGKLRLQKELSDLLKDWPADYQMFQEHIIGLYKPGANVTKLMEHVSNNRYNFDSTLLRKLTGITREQLRAELGKIAKLITEYKPDLKLEGIKFPNVFVPCASIAANIPCEDGTCNMPVSDDYVKSGQVFCSATKKLIVNKNIDTYLDILTADFTNQIRLREMVSYLDGGFILDPFIFNEHPSEVITIYQLDN